MVYVNLSEIKPMIAMPFHPSNVYTIDELNANLSDILLDVEQKALVSLDGAVEYSLQDKIRDVKLYVDQILRKRRHLRPVFNIRTKLDLYIRICFAFAVEHTIRINILIKMILLSFIWNL